MHRQRIVFQLLSTYLLLYWIIVEEWQTFGRITDLPIFFILLLLLCIPIKVKVFEYTNSRTHFSSNRTKPYGVARKWRLTIIIVYKNCVTHLFFIYWYITSRHFDLDFGRIRNYIKCMRSNVIYHFNRVYVAKIFVEFQLNRE